ncbi:uncharacterized protein LOC130762735 [Actinidia eriantha]|uniref:uncharacterized protein LOC130762735 n=1 Tax=Actinidia eriantha TaxID=165200 RepID=UPI0025909C57|nr:uncharacterized protein LOC130762735 [Actinidia eriantha]
MASATSSPNSHNSATKLTPLTPSQHQGSMKDAATENGVEDAVEKKPPSIDPFEDMNSEEFIKKFSKYEADYTLRMMAKYFSDKDIYGGNIFDKSMIVDGETIRASRWHCAQSYADPVQFLKEKSTCISTSPADTRTSISNGKHPVEEDGGLTSA